VEGHKREDIMMVLTAETFHQAMADHPDVACILHHGAYDEAMDRAAGVDADNSPYVWTRIDVDAALAIGAMFGAAEDEPFLLVMRERIVLLCQPLHARSPEATRATLEKAAGLDMAEIRRQVDESRLGRDALLNRRACPTTWRIR
jgi:hypothetical protein